MTWEPYDPCKQDLLGHGPEGQTLQTLTGTYQVRHISNIHQHIQ